MPLIDVGGGNKQFVPEDPVKQAKEILTLENLVQKNQRAKIDNVLQSERITKERGIIKKQPEEFKAAVSRAKKLKTEAEIADLEKVTAKHKATTIAIQYYNSGNPEMGDAIIERIPEYKGWKLRKHSDPTGTKQANGIVERVNIATGEVSDFDMYKDTRIQNLIDVTKDAAVKQNQMNIISNPKEMRSMLVDMEKSTGMTSEQLFPYLQNVFKMKVPGGSGQIPFALASPGVQEDHLKARFEVGQALEQVGGPQPEQETPQPTAKGRKFSQSPFRQKKNLSPKNQETITGIRSAISLVARVNAQLHSFTKNEDMRVKFGGGRWVTTPLNKMTGYFGAQNKEFETMIANMQTTLFNEINDRSGGAFTPAEIVEIKKMLPGPELTYAENRARIASLYARLASKGMATLQGAAARGERTGRTHILFAGEDPGVSSDQIEINSGAAMGLKKIWDEENLSQDARDVIMPLLPQGYRDALSVSIKRDGGNMPPALAIDQFLNNAGRKR